MAKITFKNMDRVTSELEKKILLIAEETLKENIEKFTEDIRSDIIAQTRAGKDIPNDRKQPPLAKSTIETRSYSEKYTDLHPLYSRRRSNLTMTGQLLEAVKGIVKKISGKTGYEITFEVSDTTRKQYKSEKARSKNTQRLTNKELAGYLKDKGREFLGVRKLMIDRIRRQISQDLRRNIRKILR